MACLKPNALVLIRPNIIVRKPWRVKLSHQNIVGSQICLLYRVEIDTTELSPSRQCVTKMCAASEANIRISLEQRVFTSKIEKCRTFFLGCSREFHKNVQYPCPLPPHRFTTGIACTRYNGPTTGQRVLFDVPRIILKHKNLHSFDFQEIDFST